MANADYFGGLSSPRGRRLTRQGARARPGHSIANPRVEDIASAFHEHRKRFILLATSLVNAQRLRINTFALVARLPTMFCTTGGAFAGGGLMSYGSNYLECWDEVPGGGSRPTSRSSSRLSLSWPSTSSQRKFSAAKSPPRCSSAPR